MAIAFDAATTFSGSTLNSTQSWTHTTADGANRVLVVSVSLFSQQATAIAPTGVTYGGDSLTRQIGASNVAASSAMVQELWTLATPSTGANTVEITLPHSSCSNPPKAVSITYTGSTGIGNTAGSTGNSSVHNLDITLGESDSWIVGGLSWSGDPGKSTVSGETFRGLINGNRPSGGHGDEAPGSSGLATFSETGGPARFFSFSVLELLASAAAAATLFQNRNILVLG